MLSLTDKHNNKNTTPETKKSKKGIFLRLSRYVLQQWPLFLIALLLTLGANQLSLLGPKYSGAAIDAIELESGVDFPVVWENISFMLACYVISALLSYLLSVVMINLSQRIIYKMRKQVFEKLTILPVNYFDTHATGDIISHLSYDIDTINSTLSHDLIQVMTSLYTVIGSLVFMWNISKPMILIFFITVPVSILFTRYRSKIVRPLFLVFVWYYSIIVKERQEFFLIFTYLSPLLFSFYATENAFIQYIHYFYTFMH